MALDQSFVGRNYPPTAPYEVGREKIREFAEAIGDGNPAYTDPDAAKALGHPDVIAPPTFAFTITYKAAGQVIQDPELGLDYSRVVHGDQRFAYTRPVRAGDRLTVTSTIEGIKSMAGNDILDVRGEVHDETGEHVVTAWTKLVARAAEDGGTASGQADGGPADSGGKGGV
ncbi:MaoC family dehydratase N-terminal domain-containing protein [Streptomyces sp. HPF1205]|uniref:MaoC family dehydratase N-terminal domain-containing protein n=1 Tax=Streptomyces sp. HPF1205 TaxID=2873262 RepID=UPI001CED2D95|nr:MaoC family dehydratase N-terminal domain-containing protein [Streptomyces sp. HPF1205]